ncbi:unnamed protein product [Caretta caretta]
MEPLLLPGEGGHSRLLPPCSVATAFESLAVEAAAACMAAEQSFQNTRHLAEERSLELCEVRNYCIVTLKFWQKCFDVEDGSYKHDPNHVDC